MSHFRNIACFCISCTFIFLSSCQKDDDGTDSQTLLTLQIDADYTLTGDNWIFATDGTGEVVAVEPYAPGKTVILTSSKRLDKVDVTFFNYREKADGSTENYISFDTYAGVPVGTALQFKTTKPSDRGDSKKAHFTFSNFNDAAVLFTNSYEFNQIIDDHYEGNEGDIMFFGSDVLMTSYRNGVPVYNWARGVKDGDVVSRDFAKDFTPFEHQVALNFEGSNTAFVRGLNRNPTGSFYLLDTFFLPVTRDNDHPVIGAIDGFDAYSTSVVNTKTNGQVAYEKVGAFNTAFTIPTFTFSVVKSDMQDYAFNFSLDYTYNVAGWNYNASSNFIWWDVHAAAGTTVKGLAVPADIVAKYPVIDMSKFTFSRATFTKTREGLSFLETVPGTTGTAHPTYERYIYYPNNP